MAPRERIGDRVEHAIERHAEAPAEVEAEASRRSLRRTAIWLTVTGISLYLVAPSLLDVLGSWRDVTRLEPVTEMSATAGLRASSPPTSGPGPGTTFSTPAGSPASSAMRPSISVVSGVSSLGFSTTELPAASAGPIFHAAMFSG